MQEGENGWWGPPAPCLQLGSPLLMSLLAWPARAAPPDLVRTSGCQVDGLIEREVVVAKTLVAQGKNDRALVALRRKRMHIQQYDTLQKFLINIEETVWLGWRWVSLALCRCSWEGPALKQAGRTRCAPHTLPFPFTTVPHSWQTWRERHGRSGCSIPCARAPMPSSGCKRQDVRGRLRSR